LNPNAFSRDKREINLRETQRLGFLRIGKLGVGESKLMKAGKYGLEIRRQICNSVAVNIRRVAPIDQGIFKAKTYFIGKRGLNQRQWRCTEY
jgi:hypothetical protein